MKLRYSIILVIFILASLQVIQAQDQIIKRNGEVIECKVEEIGTEEIKYTQAAFGPDLKFAILKSQVDKIVFANGQEIVIDHRERARESTELNSADLFLIQRRNAIKAEFLSPLANVTSFSYERAIKPGQSFEVSAGIIGLGFNNLYEEATGIGFKGGYKFIRSPDYYLEGQRYAHILKGGYVRPEFVFASYNLSEEDRNVTKFAILLTLGKQWVFSDIFLIDFYWGFGYGTSNAESFEDPPYYVVVADSEFPIAIAWGFRIGVLFDAKR